MTNNTYPSDPQKKLCTRCHFARMKKDICGIYCTGGFIKVDGTCDTFKDENEYRRERKRKE